MKLWWTINILTIVILLQHLSSCNVHKRFTLYKEESLPNLRTDGFYFQANKTKEIPLVFFLYKDGTVMTSGNFSTNPKSDNEEEIVSEFWYETSRKTNGQIQQHMVTIPWDQESGHYLTKFDSIKIQYFWFQTQRIIRRNVIELKGTVKNDTIISITHKRTYGTKKQGSSRLKNSWEEVYQNPIILKFHKYDVNRPDSSKVWFKQKKWYGKT